MKTITRNFTPENRVKPKDKESGRKNIELIKEGRKTFNYTRINTQNHRFVNK